MSRRAVLSVANDFQGVLKLLRDRGVVPESPPGAMVEYARKIHRATYSLILWRFRLKNQPERAKVFLEEIASDALQVLPQALMGYSKTTRLLVRGIIENVLRHIYFADHPVEFARMNREGKWYIQVEDLFGYQLIHPVILEVEPKFDAVNRLKTLYSDLSASIHGRRVQDLEMRVALNKITYESDAVQKEVQLVERCAEGVNFLLAAVHHDKFSQFQLEDRRTVLQTLPTIAKRALIALH